MMEMLKSILRMDEDQSARRVAQKYLRVVDPDYYEFESEFIGFRLPSAHSSPTKRIKQIHWLLVRKRTIATERPPLIGTFSAKFPGLKGVAWSAWPLISVL
jgi:hypothetical protein